MTVKDILNELNCLAPARKGFRLFPLDDKKYYFGKSETGDIVFVITSTNKLLKSFIQETKDLAFFFNANVIFSIDDKNDDSQAEIIHLLQCKSSSPDAEEAFVRLTQAFALNNFEEDQYYLTKLFNLLSSLYAQNHSASEKELQGLYAELFSILYLKQNGYDIGSFWQSKNRMKFDFSIDEHKRIEIKSTTKPNRIHRFKHAQLLSDLYDIKVISLLLQKNDYGTSLYDLISKIFEEFENNLPLISHIESTIHDLNEEELQTLKYDEIFTRQNLKVYNASDLAHFQELNPDGISNAEYDCDLTGCPEITIQELGNWINN